MRKKAKDDEFDGLYDPLFLETVFIPWYILGGTQRGMSYDEIVSMPPEHKHDFLYVNGVISDEREKMRISKPKEPKKRMGKRH